MSTSEHRSSKTKIPQLNNVHKSYFHEFSKDSSIHDQSTSRNHKNSSSQYPLSSDRSALTSRNKFKQKHAADSEISSYNIQFHKKLLSDIRMYQKQVAQLKRQNSYLLTKYSQFDHKYTELKKTHIQMRRKYQECKPFLEEVSQNQIYQHQPNISLKNSFNKEIAIHQDVPVLDTSNDALEEKIRLLNNKNQQLQSQVKQLKKQLLFQNSRKYDIFLLQKNVQRAKDQTTQTSNSIHLEPFQQSLINTPKLGREQQLSEKVQMLQNYIKNIEADYRKLKDRCKNIRHLVAKQSNN